jgi:hypothetical protein
LSSGKYGSQENGVEPDTLPGPLFDVFNVYGSFDFENVTTEYYEGVCSESMVAVMVSAGLAPPRPPSPPPTSAPTALPAPSTAPTAVSLPEMTEEFRLSCKTALVVGDSIERDDRMTQDEYVRFIARLVPNGEVSVTASFATIPAVFQSSFQTLASDQTYIDVTGSKPNSSPTTEEAANLENICVVTNAAIITYENGGAQMTLAPSPAVTDTDTNTTDVTDDDLAGDWILTDEAYAACKLDMMYSDLNRDNVLDPDEYVRFINRSVNSTAATFASPADLPESFQTSFEALSGGGSGIDVAGSKPAPSPTSDQDKHLKTVCRATGKTVSVYVGGGDSNPGATAPPMDEFQKECADALSVADRDSNGVMDESEYVRFLNKLMGSTFTDFDSLADALRANYENISQGTSDGVNIDGASHGTLTSSEYEQIVFVCSETEKVLNSSKSEIEDLNDLSDEEFQHCMTILGVADVNNNGWLEPIEYVEVVNLVTNREYKGAAFSDLDELFRVSYEKSVGSNSFVDVAGAKDGNEATDEQLKNLKSVCVGLLDTVQVYETPTDGERDKCISLLKPRFLDDQSLSSDDYLWLVQKLSAETWKSMTSIEALPFVVGDNYEWVKYGGNSIDLAKVGDGSALNVSEMLSWTCERTFVAIDLALDVVAESKGDPLDFCTIPISFSDINADNNLDREEFRTLLDHFSGNAWSEDDYDTLDLSLQKVFNDYVDITTDMIPIHGSKPAANTSEAELEYLESFCGHAEGAVRSARANTLFRQSCARIIWYADTNADSKLSPKEYTQFLFELAGMNAKDQAFDDLDPQLKSNYDRFKRESNSDEVVLNSTTILESFCEATKGSLSTVQETPTPTDEGEDSNGSSSIGLMAMAGIAAGIATIVFGSGVAIYCCWAKRRRGSDSLDSAKLQVAQPECSPYTDYDPESHVGQKPTSRSSGDGRTEDISEASSAMEQFEDEPGNHDPSPKGGNIGSMEDATSEHFEDEHVSVPVEAHKAPVYVDGEYGFLQGDEIDFDAAPFDAPPVDTDWSPPESDDEDFQAFASAVPSRVEHRGNTDPEHVLHIDPMISSDVTPVNPFEQVSADNGGAVSDLPPVNPFGAVPDDAPDSFAYPQSPQSTQVYEFSSSPRTQEESSPLKSPRRSPSRDSTSSASPRLSSSHAPPSPPQRTPSNSSHTVTPGGGSVSTRAQHNLQSPTAAASHEQVNERDTDDPNSHLPKDESCLDEVILVSPIEGSKKPTFAVDESFETDDTAIEVDSSDDESSAPGESESESQPEDEDGAKSSEDESGSDCDESDDASSEAETIDDSLRPNRTLDAQRQPYYKEIKMLVAQLMPDELPNVDVMIGQFAGNEEELLRTLQNMAGSSPRAVNDDQSEDSESESSGDDGNDDDGESDDDSDNGEEEEDEDEDDDEDGDEDEEDADVDDGETESSDVGEESEEGGESNGGEGAKEEDHSESQEEDSASAGSESDESEEAEDAARGADVAESVYDEESYYSEEVVESDDEEVVESDEETIDDEEETIQSEGSDGSSVDDGSSSYESDSD